MHALVTGTNRGIGAELTGQLAAHGYTVTGTSRDGSTGTALDVTCADSIGALRDAWDGKPLDLLVCNAGVYLDRGHRLGAGFEPQVWFDTFDINVIGVFQTIEAVLPSLRAAKGKIAIVSSRMGSTVSTSGGSYAYRASKAAVLNLGRNLALDLAVDGVAVGVYHPGWVRTEMGTDAADISAAESARGLAERFAALSLGSTGCFENYDGTAIPV
ncbi:SDR family NAD(P)-dependent oxidoreductase [Pseudaestuariivita sp.]|uniref:SDR family NAD(P)-dependent oxidoreductase n=1 Tax=Pseudaestuariivita sp. TaxID=2211669 RepID=UPI0040599ACA